MSITLAASQVQIVTVGGVTVETDAQAGAVDLQVRFNGPEIIFTLYPGIVSGQILTVGSRPSIQVTINATTGFWQSSNGLSGTLGAAALTNIQNTIRGWRNSMETFAVNNGIVQGTQVAW